MSWVPSHTFPRSDIKSECISLSYTDPTEVREVVSERRINKAIGLHLIQARILKESAEISCTLFSYILDTGKIPQKWKIVEITPVCKNECNLTKRNFRPLTIIPSLSKVFETLDPNRFSLRFGNILHTNVFAYRKYHGCKTAQLMSLTDWISKEMGKSALFPWTYQNLSTLYLMSSSFVYVNFHNTVLTAKGYLLSKTLWSLTKSKRREPIFYMEWSHEKNSPELKPLPSNIFKTMMYSILSNCAIFPSTPTQLKPPTP